MKLKYLSTLALLIFSAGCSVSAQNNIDDIGMHKAETNYLGRELDKQELLVTKASVSVDSFGSTPTSTNPLDKGVNSKTSIIMLGNVPAYLPLDSSTLTDLFLMRGSVPHDGVDLAAPEGTPIHAAASGTVTLNSFEAGGYGNWIVIKHGDQFETVYGHMRAPSPLKVGTVVSQGDVIGEVGSTGGSTGNHLHFEVHKRGSNYTLLSYIPSKKAWWSPGMRAIGPKDPDYPVIELKNRDLNDKIERGKTK